MSRGLSIAFSFALSITVTRTLPSADAGTFFVIYALQIGAATLGRFGIDNLALKIVAANNSSTHSSVTHLVRIGAFTSVLAALLLFAALGGIDQTGLLALSPQGRILAAVTVIPAAAAVVAGAVLRGGGRIASGTAAELGSTPAFATTAILLAYTGVDPGLNEILAYLLICSAMTAIWSILAARSTLPKRSGPAAAVPVAAQLTSMMTSSLMFYLLTWAPVIILGIAGSPTEAAFYNVSARAVALIALVPAIQVTYLTPTFARLYASDRIGPLNSVVQAATRRATLLAVVIATPMIAAPTLVLSIFGPEYADASTALRILATSMVVVIALGPTNGLMLTCGCERAAMANNSVVLIVVGIGISAISESFGAVGVATIAGLGNVICAAVGSLILRYQSGIGSRLAFTHTLVSAK